MKVKESDYKLHERKKITNYKLFEKNFDKLENCDFSDFLLVEQ